MEDAEPKPRGDHPGAWHHVTNRGLAHRPAFEARSDVRSFLALLAQQVRKGALEVHAYSILTTHFHLLLRSPRGELSRAMMLIENRYVKQFNKLRGRDGSLFRSRFRSRIIDTEEYWFNVIRYIDANPVDAGLCARASEYEFGSARMYCGARRAPWLEGSSIEATVVRLSRGRVFNPGDYERLFGSRLDPDEQWIVERRIARGTPNRGGAERGNELLDLAPGHVIDWLRARAALADGGSIGLTLAAPAQVERAVRQVTGADPGWCLREGAAATPPWRMLEAALLRQLCGLRLEEVSLRMQLSCSGVWKLCQRHADRLAADALYAQGASSVIGSLQEGERRSAVTAGLERVQLVS
jgi:REP element-mobilizing transposase RayT